MIIYLKNEPKFITNQKLNKTNKYQVGGYIQPLNVYNALSNGTASYAVLEGAGKVMNKVLPEKVNKFMTYLSPLNHVVAWTQGSVDPRVGEETVATWHPNLQLVARLGEMVGSPKVVKGVKTGATKVGKAAIEGTAKAGNKTAKSIVISKEINKAVDKNSKYVYETRAEIPIENGYMYHTWDNPNLGFVRNGIYSISRRPGSVKIENGKYASNRFPTDLESDRIWWNTQGHNSGSNVLVTKQRGYKMSDPNSKAIPGKGVYRDSYRTTERPNVSDVVRFRFDPIGNTYTSYSPFREITTNKMSLEELFTPEEIFNRTKQEPSTSLKFFEEPSDATSIIDNYKYGGMFQYLKNGAKIHIKKKNRGSFTKWCGGNVTEECIRRGKNSSNPKIRKKATFADNARHFKHKDGGIIKAQGENSTYNLFQSLKNFKPDFSKKNVVKTEWIPKNYGEL